MRRRAGLAGLLLAMVVVVAGCEEGDDVLVRDFLLDWMANNPASTLGGFAGVGEGNEVTAALGALNTIDTVNKADELMDKGRESRDARSMDKAIELRPRDWTYRTSRAVLALDLGSLDAYDRNVKEAQQLSTDREVGGRTVSGSDREVRQRYNELRPVELRLSQDLGAGSVRDGERCVKIYGEMIAMAKQLQRAAFTANDVTQHQQWAISIDGFEDRQLQCPPPR